jgi:anti-anti-sigma factor
MTPGHDAKFDSVPDADDAALDIAVRDDDPYTEVAVGGEIDFGSHRALLDTLMGKIDHGRPRIVLEMGRVSFCDSTGLGVLVRVRQHAVSKGGWLRLAGVTPAVRRALEITNLDRLIPSYPTVRDAGSSATE